MESNFLDFMAASKSSFVHWRGTVDTAPNVTHRRNASNALPIDVAARQFTAPNLGPRRKIASA